MEDKAVKKTSKMLLVLAAIMVLSAALNAQVGRRLTVGRISNWLDTQGATWMSANLSQGQCGTWINYNWEPWPDFATDVGYHGVEITAEGEHSGHGKALYGQSAYWYGSTSWVSPAKAHWGPMGAEGTYEAGKTYDIFVNDNGPISCNSLINTPYPDFIPTLHIRRVDMPVVTVSDILQFPVAFDPIGNSFEVDPDLKVDGYLESRWADPMGLTNIEKRYGFTHPDYDAIIISELLVENTGDCNASKTWDMTTGMKFIDGLEKPDQSLTDFWLGVKHLLADVHDWTDFGADDDEGRYNGEVDWLLDYDPGERYFWTWDGDAEDFDGDDQFDPRGGPIGPGEAENPTGEFTAPEVVGYAFLHVSGPGDPADNQSQPATFRYLKYSEMLSPVFKIGTMTDAWNWMTGADGKPKYQAGFKDNPYEMVTEAQPHYDPIFGIGPYDMAPNDKIKVVVCFAVGSIPEARAIELGVGVKAGTIDLADAKQEIYEGGRDSLFAMFARAQDLYDDYISQDKEVPFVPDPPDNIVITPGVDLATLKWDAVSGADGYRIYRATGGIDNGRVYESLEQDLITATSYTDAGLIRGTSYYYYLTTVKGDLESSHFFTRNHKEVIPFKSPPTAENWADNVRAVPNPINVKGNTYKEGVAYTTGFNFDGNYRDQNTLLFANIPGLCKIYIYNSVGDLIKTLDHTSGTSDERWSPIITDDNLSPASGVYFYIIEPTGGPLVDKGICTGKIIIIR